MRALVYLFILAGIQGCDAPEPGLPGITERTYLIKNVGQALTQPKLSIVTGIPGSTIPAPVEYIDEAYKWGMDKVLPQKGSPDDIALVVGWNELPGTKVAFTNKGEGVVIQTPVGGASTNDVHVPTEEGRFIPGQRLHVEGYIPQKITDAQLMALKADIAALSEAITEGYVP